MNRKLFVGITFVILVSVLLAACTQVYSTPPAPEPTRDPLLNALATGQAQQAAGQAQLAQSLNAIQTQMAKPTATPVPADPTSAVPAPAEPVVSTQSNGWKITWLPGADLDRGNGTTFRQDAAKWNWRTVAPELWPEFPNVPNPLVPEFPVVTCPDNPNAKCVPDGLENAMMETNFCQQLAGEKCRVPVAAEHYLYFTGDYDFPGVGSCKAEGTDRIGCMLVIVNVGRVTADFSPMLAQGFRLHARYFNGNALDMAIWALVSHGSNSMMNMVSKLNPSGLQNGGANCSVPEGCKGVNIRVMFTSGNEFLELLETTVTR